MSDEIMELKEHAEHGAEEPSLAPVTLTMAILAVLVASVTLLGHRAHTEEGVLQTRSADQWAYYQSKESRRKEDVKHIKDLSIFAVQSPEKAEAAKAEDEKEVERYADEEKEIQQEARNEENEVKIAGRRADRYDLSEVLLEAALVICSITLLTRKRLFWYFGIVLSLIGIGFGVTGWIVH